VRPLDEDFRRRFNEAYNRFGGQGMRVIGYAERPFEAAVPDAKFKADTPESRNFPLSALTFIGMAAILDPPKDLVADAVAKCKSAGIKIFMVTGDHPLTATAIARQVGILPNDLADGGGNVPSQA
jgi:sodium/potassium-transporting ATPase subunit alpha